MMMSKTRLLQLDNDTRAFTLVGGYMGFFALLEAGIDEAIGQVMDVKGVRRAIIGRNMTFDEKVKTLRSLVNFYIFDVSERQKFDKLAVKARNTAEERNIVAHSPFRASAKTDGVEFFAVSANKELKFLEMDWSIDDFVGRIDAINTLDNALRSIESRMSFQRIADALLENQSSSEAAPNQIGTLGGLFQLGAHALNKGEE